MSIQVAVVPVAGQGISLLPLTKSQPKEMLAVGRKPAVQYVVEELVGSGLRRVLFITGPGKTSIENHFDMNGELVDQLRQTGREELLAELDFERHDVEYFYTRQRRQLGLGHAVLRARPMVGEEPFVLALGDSLIGRKGDSRVVARLIEEFEKGSADAVVALEEVALEDVEQSGIARPGPSTGDVVELEDVIEKPTPREAPSNLALAARYVCSPKIFNYLERTRPGKQGAIQFTDALRLLIKEGGRVLGIRLPPGETRFDIGNYESYFRAFVEFALADERYGPALARRLRRRLDADGALHG